MHLCNLYIRMFDKRMIVEVRSHYEAVEQMYDS